MKNVRRLIIGFFKIIPVAGIVMLLLVVPSGKVNAENKNVQDTLYVEEGELIYFEASSLDYIMSTADDDAKTTEINSLTAKKGQAFDKGEIFYYVKDDAKELGIKIDKNTGRLTAGRIGLLLKRLAEADEQRLSFKVWAGIEDGIYDKAAASYTVNIRLDEPIADAYVLTDADGNEIMGDADKWYNMAITVKLRDDQNYSAAKKENISEVTFRDSVVIDSQGEDLHEGIYLRSRATGRISYVPVTEITKIDTVSPKIDLEYKKEEQKVLLYIKDKYFCPKSIEYISKSEDINGNELSVNDDKVLSYLQNEDNWKVNGDTYTADISKLLADGIYKSISIGCTDKAGNKGERIYDLNDDFVVDHTSPDTADMTIEYLGPVKREGAYCYYNKSGAVVTFTARDEISGISAFEWAYVEEENADNFDVSDTYYRGLEFVQDEKDKSKYTAVLKLPENEADQMRGYILFRTKDGSGNLSKAYSDRENVIIIDSKAPIFLAELYDEPVGTVENKLYYNHDCNITFEIEEANFDKKAVRAYCSMNQGKSFTDISSKIIWNDMKSDNTELHEGVYRINAGNEHLNDGEYIFKMEYTDKSGNKMDMHISEQIYVIDTTPPVIDVSYLNNDVKNTETDSSGNKRKYFNSAQTAVITVNEHNFNGADFNISAKNIRGEFLDNRYSISKWTTDEKNANLHRAVITYDKEANFSFDMACIDTAANSTKYGTDYFTVDMTPPTGFTISCSPAVTDTDIAGEAYGFYRSNMTVTVLAYDDISGIYSFASGTDDNSSVGSNIKADEGDISFLGNSGSASVTFQIPAGTQEENNQFNGIVKISATDKAGNISNENTASKRIVVDSIAPSASVTYNTPVNISEGTSYYDGNINAVLRINETNFFKEDVTIKVFKDGMPYNVVPVWTDRGLGDHIGSFALFEDGSYKIKVSYKDKSGNGMQDYLSESLEIDTRLDEPIILINGEDGNKRAYKGDVASYISFYDKNFEDYSIRLTRTGLNDKDRDVTKEFAGSGIAVDKNGGEGCLNSFDMNRGTDGIYTLTVGITDKACHKTEKTIVFTVNRYGSVYVYSDYLNELISNGGAYVKELTDDLIITEYNADKLLEGSLKIEISRDGRLVDNAVFEVEPVINDDVEAGKSGWYQYSYRIRRENFLSDGIYKISVSSKDKAGNRPETTNYEDKNILFRIDSTAPVISSIKGLEKSIIDAYEAKADYTIYDAIGLYSVQVLLDGKQIDNITDFGDDPNNFHGSFVVKESNSKRNIRLIVKDRAGNITDTADDSFKAGCTYEFNEWITISSNPIVRTLAWIRTNILKTVILVLAIVAFVILTIVYVKKKKTEI